MLNVLQDKFVLWGLGKRGEIFGEVFGVQNIVAVIDRNPKFIGAFWHGIPCITLEEYKRGYNAYPVLVTPVQYEPIVALLMAYGVRDFYKLNDMLVPDMFAAYLSGSRTNSESIFAKLRLARCPVINFIDEGVYAPIAVFCENKLHHTDQTVKFPADMDAFMVQGLNMTFFMMGFYNFFYKENIHALFVEDGFIYSLFPNNAKFVPLKYRRGHSFIADSQGIYLNAGAPSALENMLNSSLELTTEQHLRTQKLIDKILIAKISKYNHQPIRKLMYSGQKDDMRKKILVVDQVCEDKSILFGLADDETTFDEMLHAAIQEHPGADILIKTHPAANKGHYDDFPASDYDNVYFLDQAINPISLLEVVDEVYVCTSQIGFEAVLCGKKTHVFGMPFYAGWGVTHDRIHCERRTRRRTKEEIFYMAYILYTRYVSFKQQAECEIEVAIDEILELREQYWKELRKEA